MLTSLTLSILATRGGSGTPDLLKKAIPAAGQKGPLPAQTQAPAPGSTVPITVQTGVDGGKQGAPQTIAGTGGAGASARSRSRSSCRVASLIPPAEVAELADALA